MKKILNIISKFLPDKMYLKVLYRIKMGKKLNLEYPKTYNEKLQWLKLYDRNNKYGKMVDKFDVKEYVAKKVGEEYIIPTIGIYDNFNEIPFEELPNEFVIKCTHDSGGLVVCKDKSKLNIAETEKIINKALKRNYYYTRREWPYKLVKPRIIIEKYMVDESGYELKDYKFFCFSGKAKAMFIATDRNAETETCFDFYDMNFEHLPFTNGHPNATKNINKPDNFEEMQRIAEKISEDLIHVRVDLYNINGKIYFGEMTFYHFGGMVPFVPEEWDYKFGDWIDLPIGKE